MQHNYPHGVLGVDSAEDPESHMYGEVARDALEKEERRRRALQRRQDRLRRMTQSVRRHGFDILAPGAEGAEEAKEAEGEEPMAGAMPRSHRPMDGGRKMFPSKGRGAARRADSMGQMLLTPAPFRHNATRRQHLVDMATAGRRYDIISGAERPPHIRPEIPEKKKTRHAHPSITEFSHVLDR